ncbi:MAG: sel1 repeat family protein [bacterium]|nr:sel1 repeat family protein [bacterium]
MGVERDDKEAVRWYKRAAEQDEPGGLANMGFMHLKGFGVDKDEARARAYYERSAEQGFPSAQLDLAKMLTTDRGGPVDLENAYFWASVCADGAGTNRSNAERLKAFIAEGMSEAQLTSAARKIEARLTATK